MHDRQALAAAVLDLARRKRYPTLRIELGERTFWTPWTPSGWKQDTNRWSGDELLAVQAALEQTT